MIITENTGTSNNKVNAFCKCSNNYGGDRIVIEDSVFIPILGGVRQHDLDISPFFKNVGQANIINFKLNKGQVKYLASPDDQGMKFLAISVDKPSSPLYWRKKYDSVIDEYITAMFNGSFSITTSPFVQDHISATLDLTLASDNSFQYITWTTFTTSFINGSYGSSWANASSPWTTYSPILTTNRHVVANNVASVPFTITQDSQGNFLGEVSEVINVGNYAITFKLTFHGKYPDTFVIDTLSLSLDGHFLGSLYVAPGTPVTDFVTLPLCMKVDHVFKASSGLIEVYDKVVGLMVLTSTDNEPIQPIKLLNNGADQVKVSMMVGS